jgi:hypothetical protein
MSCQRSQLCEGLLAYSPKMAYNQRPEETGGASSPEAH